MQKGSRGKEKQTSNAKFETKTTNAGPIMSDIEKGYSRTKTEMISDSYEDSVGRGPNRGSVELRLDEKLRVQNLSVMFHSRAIRCGFLEMVCFGNG